MDKSTTFKVAGNNASIIFELLNYERPASADFYDANWITCNLHLSIYPFEGAFCISILAQDLSEFYRQLEMLYDFTARHATFSTIEGGIQFDIDMDGLGNATVKGSSTFTESTEVTISFLFHTDQTYLRETLANLKHVLEAFPVRA